MRALPGPSSRLGEREGSAIFVDANIFVYHFTEVSDECTSLLTRCETTELRGATSAVVLAEVCHRLMMIEAVERKLVSVGNVARKLARRPVVATMLNQGIRLLASVDRRLALASEIEITGPADLS